jgi:hypothetical protein
MILLSLQGVTVGAGVDVDAAVGAFTAALVPVHLPETPGAAVGAGAVDDAAVGAFTAAFVPVVVSSQRFWKVNRHEGSRKGPRIHIHIHPCPYE